MRRILIMGLRGMVRLYQLAVSPFFPANCRYMPTCSAYAMEALQAHGPFRGSWLTLRRLLRCHPLGGWGYDPVPPAGKSSAGQSCGHVHADTVRSHSRAGHV